MKLKDTKLFHNTGLNPTNVEIKQFLPGAIIELEGDFGEYIGVVLSGIVQVITYTLEGSSIILNTLDEGSVYGDILIYSSLRHTYPGNLIAKTKTTIATISHVDIDRFIEENKMFRKNFLAMLSDKVYQGNILNKLLSQDTLREKILFYLNQERKKQNSNTIILHMTKEDFARMLHVQRPSLSRELSNMKKEGLIDYNRRSITILV
jgi:CRP-like cAMP-binding protein